LRLSELTWHAHEDFNFTAQDWTMETPDNRSSALPAFAAVGILALFVLLSISGYLILSAR